MPVHKASARDELMRAATALQPSVGGGQVTFLLAGQGTAAALAASWERCLTYPGDTVFLAETSGQLVGACGLLVSDETHTQTINGPVVRPRSADDEDAFKTPIREQFDEQSDAYYSTARLWDDGIVDPAHTRTLLGLALETARYAPLADQRYGVFRM